MLVLGYRQHPDDLFTGARQPAGDVNRPRKRTLRAKALTAMLLALAAVAGCQPAAAQDCIAQSCNRFMSTPDLGSLPLDVAAPFRDPVSYRRNAEGGLVPRIENNCISFALDAFGQQSLTGAATPSWIEDVQTRFRGDRCRQAFEMLRHRSDVQVRYATDLQCAPGSWLVVVMFRPSIGLLPDLAKGIHLVRQLSDGRFAQILGPNEPIAWVVRHGRIVDRPQDLLPFNTGFDEACTPLCVSKRNSMVPGPVSMAAIAGAWTSVRADPVAQPVPFTKGTPCGPYEQKMELLLGVPPGWFGDLIPGAPIGAQAAALEIQSNILGDPAGFSYGGVNLTLSGRVAGNPARTLVFDRFYDISGHDGRGEPDRQTGARKPPMLDPNNGVRLEILSVDRNVMLARLEAQTVCPTEIVFHRTRAIRGKPERVR